jgi:hypothetical protein
VSLESRVRVEIPTLFITLVRPMNSRVSGGLVTNEHEWTKEL